MQEKFPYVYLYVSELLTLASAPMKDVWVIYFCFRTLPPLPLMQIIPSLYNFLGACALCFNQLILVPTLSFRFQSRNLNITPITISFDLVCVWPIMHCMELLTSVVQLLTWKDLSFWILAYFKFFFFFFSQTPYSQGDIRYFLHQFASHFSSIWIQFNYILIRLNWNWF
jgi:hypothetical protein